MYLDPRNQITGGFGGVKRVDFGKREKRIEDLKKQLDEERVKIPQNPLIPKMRRVQFKVDGPDRHKISHRSRSSGHLGIR